MGIVVAHSARTHAVGQESGPPDGRTAAARGLRGKVGVGAFRWFTCRSNQLVDKQMSNEMVDHEARNKSAMTGLVLAGRGVRCSTAELT